MINNLEREYPGTRDLIMDVDEDDLLPGLAVVVDGETSLLGLLERVQESSEVHFLPPSAALTRSQPSIVVYAI